MTRLNDIRNYWNTRSEGYRLQIEEELNEHTDEMYDKYFRCFPKGSSVLDIGCGPGFFSLLLARLGMEVTAADYSEDMLREATAFVARNGYRLKEAVRADAQNLPFASELFDFVVSRNVVWNLENPTAAYAEWFRVLKPGGSLLVFDGNHYCYLYREEFAEVQNAVDNHNRHILLGVRTQLIDDIAKELPLSRRVRPQWDRETLEKLGAEHIESEILVFEEGPSGQRLPIKFFISAKKRATD